jgi:hypothetical protein
MFTRSFIWVFGARGLGLKFNHQTQTQKIKPIIWFEYSSNALVTLFEMKSQGHLQQKRLKLTCELIFNPKTQNTRKTSNKISIIENLKRTQNGMIECSVILKILCDCLDFEVGLVG